MNHEYHCLNCRKSIEVYLEGQHMLYEHPAPDCPFCGTDLLVGDLPDSIPCALCEAPIDTETSGHWHPDEPTYLVCETCTLEDAM